jgi:UDP-glucose 4-epimerase
MITGKRVFITGGAGFIGSTLAGMLLDHNEVVIYDNFARNSIDSKPFREHRNLKVVKGDVLDCDNLNRAIEGSNYVVHCAAIAGIDTVIIKPVTTMRVNMIGSANLLCFSTSEVFGTHGVQATEADKTVIGVVGEARWTYAVSKLAEEHLAFAYHKEFGLPATAVRPFNVYGPGQVGEGAMRGFVMRALKDEPIEIHGTGTQIRAWCFVDDMIRGVLLAMEHPNAIGESFNIGNERAVVTIYGLASAVVRVLGSKSKISFVRKDYADVELRVPSVEKSRRLLGFEAEVDLEDGIARTARYYQDQV